MHSSISSRIDSPTDVHERADGNRWPRRHIRRSLYHYRVEGSTLADIIPLFRAVLFSKPSIDLAITYADLAISDLISDIAEGVLKDIPLVNTMHALWETANNIRKRNTARQMLTFIGELNAGIVSAEKLKEYHNKLEDPKTAEDELGRVLFLLDSTIETRKTRINARLFRAYVEQSISWEQFCELSEITSRVFLSDLELLASLIDKKDVLLDSNTEHIANRLNSVGLVVIGTITLMYPGVSPTESFINASVLGRLFISIVGENY